MSEYKILSISNSDDFNTHIQLRNDSIVSLNNLSTAYTLESTIRFNESSDLKKSFIATITNSGLLNLRLNFLQAKELTKHRYQYEVILVKISDGTRKKILHGDIFVSQYLGN